MAPQNQEQDNVLLLGSGFVARPAAEVLDSSNIKVTIACRTLKAAQKLAAGLPNVHPISLDINDAKALDDEVSKNALIVSLVPFTLHVAVVQSAIKHKRHVVTTSYISPAMAELDKAAKDAGITVLNEIGLDPGIDHLYAVKTFEETHKAGGKVLSFLSYCGGLPAPECSDNPLGYKFSWSSRGVLLALKNSAKYLENGKVVDVVAGKLMETARPYHIYPGFSFVAYPNRDSTIYRERYQIPEAETVIRGSLRYGGFPEFVSCLVDIGFLDESKLDFLKPSESPPSWKEATAKILGATSVNEDDLIWAVSSKTTFSSTDEKERIIAGLRWIGLFSDEPINARGTPLDTLCATLEEKCAYASGERDMVMLQHKFQLESKDGKKHTKTSTLVAYGDPNGHSAMAKLVGVPCAIAVRLVLNGTISKRGVIAPMTPDINEPLLSELKDKHGIFLEEKDL